jgi:hypothetical protein
LKQPRSDRGNAKGRCSVEPDSGAFVDIGMRNPVSQREIHPDNWQCDDLPEEKIVPRIQEILRRGQN